MLDLPTVALSQVVYNLCNGLQAPHFGPSIEPLKQTKAPVRSKLCVPYHKVICVCRHARPGTRACSCSCSGLCSCQHGASLLVKEIVQLTDDSLPALLANVKMVKGTTRNPHSVVILDNCTAHVPVILDNCTVPCP